MRQMLSTPNSRATLHLSRFWEELSDIVCCPEDRGQLVFCGSEYSCRICSRHFPILSGRIADFRPRSPQPVPRDTNLQFARDYLEVFHRPCEQTNQAVGWGAREVVTPRWARRRERQVEHVKSILQREKGCDMHTCCDFSAGAGYYTLGLAALFPGFLHCDLSSDSLFYAAHKVESRGINNVVFLRIDYLQPPFAGRLDCVICMDSLERGEGHERVLLGSIRRSLRPGGLGIVDFHNWWHNPLRRLGVLPQNFGFNRSYSRSEAEALLRSCGIKDFQYLPFCQEFEPSRMLGQIATTVLPSTRHVFLFKEPGFEAF